MRPWITSLIVLGVLGACSAASAQWTYVGPAAVPAPAVYSYWPGAPVAPAYVYRPAGVTVYRPAVTVYRPAVVAVRTVPVAPAPAVVYSAPFAYPAVYPAPVVIRARAYYPGQPVRNAVRAVLP